MKTLVNAFGKIFGYLAVFGVIFWVWGQLFEATGGFEAAEQYQEVERAAIAAALARAKALEKVRGQ